MKDSNGVVIVFNPDVPSHLKEVETWYSTFMSSQGLQEAQCLLIAHHKPGSGTDTTRPSLGNLPSHYSIRTLQVEFWFKTEWKGNVFSQHPFKKSFLKLHMNSYLKPN